MPDRPARPAALVTIVTAAWLSVGCEPASEAPVASSPAAPARTEAIAAHVLSRIGYGPDAWSRARIEAIGAEAYIEEQLAPASIDDPEIDALQATRPALSMGFHRLLEAYPPGTSEFSRPLGELTEMKLLRSIHSRRQLEQVLVDFWYDHFNVHALDGVALLAVVPYERDAIRPHVLGRFEDMLRAVARSPAMLYYLDNWRSTREGFVLDGELRGLNENYARELLELHTVGVDGGYDQSDVVEVARAFTGWTIGLPQAADADGFLFWSPAHDPDAKSLMGTLSMPAGGGRRDGEDVIAFLARHPRTAEHLCRKLVARFVDESPPPETVAACADAYLAADGDLGAATRAVLRSPAFLDPARVGGKVKRPLQFVASLARATGLPTEGVVLQPGPGGYTLLDALIHFMDLMGEPLYRAPAPAGLPDDSAHWASGGGLVLRLRLIDGLVGAGLLPGIDGSSMPGSDARLVDDLTRRLVPSGIASTTRGAVLAHLASSGGPTASTRGREATALLLSSPEFMRH